MAQRKRINTRRIINSKKVGTVVEDEAHKKHLLPRPAVILLLIAGFFILGSLIYKNKQLFIVGIVNNRPITSFELYKRMASQSGKQIFDQIVVEQLLTKEAKKKNLAVSDEDINNEIARIEQNLGNGLSLNDALSQQGMTIDDLKEQVRLRLTAMKLIEDKVTVTDEEVNKYITDNKDFLAKEEDPSKQKESVQQLLKEQKVNSEIQALIQNLKSSAKITSFL